MRAFIPFKEHAPRNANCYAAWLGFYEMGIEIVPYFEPSGLSSVQKEDIVVGGIGSCHAVLRSFGVAIPRINYPESLRSFLGRRLWRSTINQVNNDSGSTARSYPVYPISSAAAQVAKILLSYAAKSYNSGQNGAALYGTGRFLTYAHTGATGDSISIRQL